MRSVFRYCAGVAVLVMCATFVQAADSIGVNFYLNGCSSGIVAPEETAGAPGYEQANWNNFAAHSQNWQTESFANAVDSGGTAKGMDVTLTTTGAGDMWYATCSARTTPDQRLMSMAALEQRYEGYNGWFSSGVMNMDVANVPYSAYDLVIYINHANVAAAARLLQFTIGSTVMSATSTVGFGDDTYTQSDGAGSDGDYLVFSGLTGSSFTLVMEQMTTGHWNAGMTAFQIVEAVSIIPGDANHDGIVDTQDFTILKSNFGTISGGTWAMGDFTGDGIVDTQDFTILKAHFGQSQGADVPEPMTLSLLALLALSLPKRGGVTFLRRRSGQVPRRRE